MVGGRSDTLSRRLALHVMAAGGFVLVSGCGLTDAFETGPVFSMQWVALDAEPRANRDQPVAVDLVILYQAELIARLEKLPAADWFLRKAQFQRDFPRGFSIISWELVPDQSIPARQLTGDELRTGSGDRAVGAFVFAQYATPGDHRARVLTQTGVRIVLAADTFTLEPYNPGS